jgi:Family of unknown function (DUF5687)
MKRIFLIHQWKYFLRSRGKHKSIIEQLTSSFFSLNILVVVFYTGFSLENFLQYYYSRANIENAFCSLILMYFGIDIVIRFFWQKLPTMAIQPYLLQNIRRKEIVSFLNIRSLFSFLNILPLLLFLPFISTVINKVYGSLAAVSMAFSILLICMGNNFLALFIKRFTINRNEWLFIFPIGALICGLLNYYGIISIGKYSSIVFIEILNHPLVSVFFLFYLRFCLYVNNMLLTKNIYYEENSGRPRKLAYTDSLIANMGLGEGIIDINIKSIMRNKKPRYFLLLSIVFLLYGIVMFQKNMLDKHELVLPLFGGMIITGLFGICYGQFLFAWDSSYFDALMTYNLSLKGFIKDKFRLIVLICTIFFLTSLLYGFKDVRLIFILLAVYLFNIGILPVVAIYFALFNYKRIDLARNMQFNFQGLGPGQMIYSSVLALLAAFIYVPFHFFHFEWAGVICIGLAGLLNFMLQRLWIKFLLGQFIKKKYKILDGFREK